jgi:hypothetical protein
MLKVECEVVLGADTDPGEVVVFDMESMLIFSKLAADTASIVRLLLRLRVEIGAEV